MVDSPSTLSPAEQAPSAQATRHAVLRLRAPQRPGLMHDITGALVDHRGDVLRWDQFDDHRAGNYYLRAEVALPKAAELEPLGAQLVALAEAEGGEAELYDASRRLRVIIMVSRYGHCLNDLLFRTRSGEMPIDIVAVVSNHEDHRSLVEWNGIPFHHIPVTPATKPEAEARLLGLVDELDVDLVVLARYMQVLSDEAVTALHGRAINIHHSFLPSFKGAKPYHQAWERGVKTVGATAHYVSGDLDEGPIISQQVMEVDHAYAPTELVSAGRDSECAALAHAVRWHAEGRIFLDGLRTIVLR